MPLTNGIAPAPRGTPQIEVEVAIDANGILEVTATDKGTGKKADIRIENSGGLSSDEIDKMKADAEAHAEEDRKRREVVDTKNRGDALVSQTRKSLEEHGDNVSAEARSNIESALSSLEEKLKGEDKAAIDAAIEELSKVSMELGKAVYEAEAEKAGGAPADGADAPADGETVEGDVIDAEYEVKEDDAKA